MKTVLNIEKGYTDYDAADQAAPSRLESFRFSEEGKAEAALAEAEAKVATLDEEERALFNVWLSDPESVELDPEPGVIAKLIDDMVDGA